MPSISEFYGLSIYMYNNGREHNPPHFHALYQGHEGVFNLEGELMEGEMPTRQRKFIAAWAELHKDELLANWELAEKKQSLYKIEPLR